MKFQVRQNDIVAGVPRATTMCAVALAARRNTGKPYEVAYKRPLFDPTPTKPDRVVYLPVMVLDDKDLTAPEIFDLRVAGAKDGRSLQHWLTAFDEGREVQPIELETYFAGPQGRLLNEMSEEDYVRPPTWLYRHTHLW